MFRRLPHTLPKDPNFPADLEKLGYFINEEDQIRQIRNPGQKYQFSISRNDRVNEICKEAMNTCLRNIVKDRLRDQGLEILRLPLGSNANENHVPIFVSKDLNTKKRVIVILGERSQDLGVFSYRVIGDKGINSGSAVEFCNAVLNSPSTVDDEGCPGIIITNPAQLHWYRRQARAVTYREWLNLPRTSAVHEAPRLDQKGNSIPHNRDYEEHVRYIFQHVLARLTRSDTCFDFIALECPGRAALQYLAKNWSSWSHKIGGICLGSPQHTLQDLQPDTGNSDAFPEFVKKRCRAYFVSDAPVETPMTGRTEYGCNCYSSGEPWYQENIIVQAWRSMLDWFNLIHSSSGYEEPDFDFVEGTENSA